MRRLLASVILFALASATPASAEDALSFGPFGRVAIYRSRPHPSHVVLFVSGDGGWNLGVIDMARALSEEDALVAGIDITRYLKNLEKAEAACAYPAGDLQNLARFIEKKMGFRDYTLPILVGYSSGATLVYASLAQAPPNTFRGAISLGFCPDLNLTKPFCRGYGLDWIKNPKGKGILFRPAQHLDSPWTALQGTIDQVCNADATREYVQQVPNGQIRLLPKVGHGFSVQRNWMPQFWEAFAKISRAAAPEPSSSESSLKDLPLVELPAAGEKESLAVIVSGDGGWASLDRDVGNYLSGIGIPVVGLNSLRYFWSARTPEEISRDLNRVLSCYLNAWNKKRAVLIGYSFGADVLPFMASRLPPETLDRVSGLVLLGPSMTAKFEFHLTDWIGGSGSKKGEPVLPEVEKIAGTKILCMAGAEEADSLCLKLDRRKFRVEILSGGHHFGGEYERIGRLIAGEMGLK
jgi:type IV secretory pathway VirJ component